MMLILFWLIAVILVYTYVGFPLLLWGLSRFFGYTVKWDDEFLPRVSLIISAYNEERSIEKTLQNVLQLDYPPGKREILVASDGSTDATDEIVSRFASLGVKLVACPRSGKEGARAVAVAAAAGEILMFADANNMWERDAMKKLVRNFADPLIGCVSGKTVYPRDRENIVSKGSGTYWRYEDFTKRLEGRMGHLIALDGPIFAMRRDLFEPVPQVGAADMIVPLRVQERGLLAVYEPAAIGIEEPRRESGQEIRSRIRIVVRGFWNLRLQKRLLNPFYKPAITFYLVSHKLLRWLAPEFLISLLLVNLFLLGNRFYWVTMGLQVMFYGAAVAGLARVGTGKSFFGMPYYFCLINYCALAGFARFLMGGSVPTWDPER